MLDGLRLNQLNLSRSLVGKLSASEERIHISARGSRPDEALDFDLALPFAPGTSLAAQQDVGWSQSEGFGKAPAAPEADVSSPQVEGGGHFALRCGPLSISAEVRPGAVKSG